MKENKTQHGLRLLSVDHTPGTEEIEKVFLKTDNGTIPCLYHSTKEGLAAVIFVGGVGGGWDGPARGSYERWSYELSGNNIAALRVDFRYAGDLISCVLDTLMGIEFLKSKGKNKIILIGHSFGGAVVIQAGAVRRSVAGVVALSSQTYGTDPVHQIAPRPILLIHGIDDEILPASCSKDIYARAEEPKEILLYNSCRHGLDECINQLDKDLLFWIRSVLK